MFICIKLSVLRESHGFGGPSIVNTDFPGEKAKEKKVKSREPVST